MRSIGFIGWDSKENRPGVGATRTRYGRTTKQYPKVHPTKKPAEAHGGGDTIMEVFVKDTRRCASCGLPGYDHPVRHPFVPAE